MEITELELKPVSEIVIVSYKVISLEEVLYCGFSKDEANEAYKQAVNDKMSVQHIWYSTTIKNYAACYKLSAAQTVEATMNLGPPEIKAVMESLYCKGSAIRSDVAVNKDLLQEAVNLYPHYFTEKK